MVCTNRNRNENEIFLPSLLFFFYQILSSYRNSLPLLNIILYIIVTFAFIAFLLSKATAAITSIFDTFLLTLYPLFLQPTNDSP